MKKNRYILALMCGFLSCFSFIHAEEQPKSADKKEKPSAEKTETKPVGYPQSTNKYINDFAKILEPADAERIQQTLGAVEEKTGIEICVVTINAITDYQGTETDFRLFATSLFNTWGIGKKDKNNGVLFLVSVKDRKVRIELGSGYQTYYNEQAARIIKNDIVPYFKQNQYSRGIFEGTRALIAALTKEVSWWDFYKWHLLLGLLILILVGICISCFRSGKKGWGWAIIALIGGLLVLLWSMSSGNKSDGFGGGKSSGGGASGDW